MQRPVLFWPRTSRKVKPVKPDRIKWNKRYSEKDPGQRIPRIVRAYIDRAPAGRALDIACGTGAVSLFLAERGYTVDAVDISDVALAAFADRHPAIRGICADLDLNASFTHLVHYLVTIVNKNTKRLLRVLPMCCSFGNDDVFLSSQKVKVISR